MILLPFHLLLVKGGIVSSIVGNRLLLAKKVANNRQAPLDKKTQNSAGGRYMYLETTVLTRNTVQIKSFTMPIPQFLFFAILTTGSSHYFSSKLYDDNFNVIAVLCRKK